MSALLSTLLLSALPQIPEVDRPQEHRGSLLVSAKTIYLRADRVLQDSAILIRDGKVAFVGDEIPAEARKSATKVDYPNGTLVPGFVNAHTSLGLAKHLAEKIDTFTPELLAADAFDPFAELLEKSARQGITAAGLGPASTNAFCGQGAVVHTGTIGGVLRETSFLKMSMIDAAFDQNRYPTSRMGAFELVRRVVKQVKSPLGPLDPRLKPIAEVLSGDRYLAVRVSTQTEIESTLDLCAELGIKPLLVGCAEGHKCVARIKAGAAGVVLGPVGFGSSKEQLGFAAALEKASVPFSLAAERPADLRLSAALFVRHGASRSGMLAAVTQTAAAHAGAEDICGSLFTGRRADFNVFVGHPLDLSARLQTTWLAGVELPKQKEAR